MEFRVNQIDTELIQRVNETTKQGKIHRKESVLIDKDSEKENKGQKNFKDTLKQAEKKSNKVVVEAVKTEQHEIEAVNEGLDTITAKGKFLDIRK